MPIIRRMDREMAVYSYSGVVVQLLNHVQFFATPWAAAGQAPLSPRVCSNLCPLNQCYYLTISSCATLFFSLPSLPASGSFPMSQLFASGGQSIGASATILPMKIQG